MRALLDEILREEELKKLAEAVEKGACPAVVSGLGSAQRAAAAAALAEKTGIGVCVICSEEQEALRVAADMRVLTGRPIELITEREPVFYQVLGASRKQEQDRLTAFHRIQTGQTAAAVATVGGLLLRTLPPEDLPLP